MSELICRMLNVPIAMVEWIAKVPKGLFLKPRKISKTSEHTLNSALSNLSNSSRMLCYADPVVSVTIFDNKGNKRDVKVNSK